MNRRDRVFAALRHQQTDIVPYQIDFTSEALRKTAAWYGDPAIAQHFGNHLANAMYDIYAATHREIRPEVFQDHLGGVEPHGG